MKYFSIPGLERGCSQIVLGTSSFTPEDADDVFAILDHYVEHGGNTLDTSRVYGLGKSEEVLTMWLKARQNRQNVIIINKGCHHYVDATGCHHPEQQRVSPEILTQDLRESMARMQVDYFDIYLLHRDNPAVPVGELIDALQEHKNAGLIKAYGVSNWSTKRIDAANTYAASKGYAGIVVNSPSLSLAQINESRWGGCVYVDQDYIKWHEKNQLALFSWASQASGFFTGIYTRENVPNPDIARVYYNDANWERMHRAKQLAKQKGNQFSANHIALAYVLNQFFPICAVIGPQKVSELLSSLEAVNIELSEKERLWLCKPGKA